MTNDNRKDSSLSNPIEFFKVYFSNFSSCQLKFPPALILHLKRTIPNNATLKDHNGKVWNVKLEKDQSDFIITDGWQDFVAYHCLNYGDFLVFKYDGNSHFDVESYKADGFKRGKVSASETFIMQVKEEEETEPWQNVGQPTSGCKRKYSEMSPERTQRSGSLKGKQAESRKTEKRKVGRPRLAKTESDVKPKNLCFEGITTERKVKTTSDVKPKNPYFEGRTTKRKVRRPRLAKKASYVKPKNPYFEATITNSQSSRYLVHIPVSLQADPNIKLKGDMKLRDENGKSWPVKISFSKINGARITSGWINFCRANKVSVGDKCIIEFVTQKGNASSIMQVRVHEKSQQFSRSWNVKA